MHHIAVLLKSRHLLCPLHIAVRAAGQLSGNLGQERVCLDKPVQSKVSDTGTLFIHCPRRQALKGTLCLRIEAGIGNYRSMQITRYVLEPSRL